MTIISYQPLIKFQIVVNGFFRFVILMLLLTSFQYLVSGQGVQMATSRAESMADGVNLFSGELEQSIPLLNIKGRGEISHSLLLPIRNIKWQVYLAFLDNQSYPDRYIEKYRALLGEPSTYPFQENTSPALMSRGGYAWAGKIRGETKRAGLYAFDPLVTTSLTFTSNDGSTMEFRDATDGQLLDYHARGCPGPYFPPSQPVPQACSRGRVFHSIKGEDAIFVADSDIYDLLNYDIMGNELPNAQTMISGSLFLSNGTRMIFTTGFLTKIIDRNGNFINFEYAHHLPTYLFALSKITDSLNREIIFNYGDWTQSSYFDEIVYKGFGGAQRGIRINYKEASQALAPGQQQQTSEQLFPNVLSRCYFYNGGTCGTSPAAGVPLHVSPKVVSSIVLPDQRQFQFQYNSYSELSRIVYPTGTYLEYGYSGLIGAASNGFQEPLGWGGGGIYRRVSSVKTVEASGQIVSEKTLSNIPQQIQPSSTIVDNVTIEVKNGHGMVLGKSRHYFYGIGISSTWRHGKEHTVETLDPTTGIVIRKTETKWEQRAPFPWCAGLLQQYACDEVNWPGSSPPVDPRITQVKTTLETGEVTKKTFSYDQYNNVTDTFEFDYGEGQPGSLLRRSHIDYVTDPIYTNSEGPNLKRLPSQSWVSSDAAGNNKVSLTQFEYDNYTPDTNHAALISRSSVTGHDTTSYGTNFTSRGNITAVTSYANASSMTGGVTGYFQYDILGNVVKNIDANGHASTVSYNDNFGAPDNNATTHTAPSQLNGLNTFGYPTSTTNPIGWTAHSQYDYFTGAPVNTQDINGLISKTIYNDDLDRPTQTVSAIGTANEIQSSVVYDDANRRIQNTSDLNVLNDNLIKSESFYDGLGRTTEDRSYKDGDYVAVFTQYDALGRVKQVTNPYRPLRNETVLWTKTKYDTFSQVIEVEMPDGSKTTNSYLGTSVTSTDAAGKKRKWVSNALGKVTKTIEDPIGLDIETEYVYDTAGNLRRTIQGNQNRYFMFDSLGRLIYEKQTELEANTSFTVTDPVTGNSSWSKKYEYDNNSNILKVTNALGVYMEGTYDELDRLIERDYSDLTPDVAFTYDDPSIPFSKGQTTKVANSVSETKFTGFDILGRLLRHEQVTDGQTYSTAYTYNLSGELFEETYPSGRVVRNILNNDGELSTVQSRKNENYGFHNYASHFTYNSAGAIESMRLGNGRWETAQYNNVSQITQIGLGSTESTQNLLKLEFGYGNPTQDNGSIKEQKITVPTVGQTSGFTAVQTYAYDELNRILSATETVSSTETWKQTFIYDRFGNRRFDTNGGNTTTLGTCPTAVCNPAINTANNRFSNGQGYSYDANGSLTQDANGFQFSYNADNQQTKITDAQNNIYGEYFYDGEGRRVKKITASETTVFVYNADAKLIAEYSTVLSQTPQVSYLTTDHLATPRIITNENGEITGRKDYTAFGEEIVSSQRAAGLGYSNPGQTRKGFTGYEKDDESGLDFAQARYYKALHGRFTTVDPMNESASPDKPQTFNRYAYVTNDPLNYIDPSGLESCSAEFSYWECGGASGIRNNQFGDYYAFYNREFGGLSDNTANAMGAHMGRVNKAFYSKGSPSTHESVVETFLQHWAGYDDGRTKVWFEKGALEVRTFLPLSWVRLNRLRDISAALADNFTLGQYSNLQNIYSQWMYGTDVIKTESKEYQDTDTVVMIATAPLPGPGKIKSVVRHRKAIKSIVKNASKPEVRLNDQKIEQLRRVVNKAGGNLRTEKGQRGTMKGVWHSQVEGFGPRISHRHIIHLNQR